MIKNINDTIVFDFSKFMQKIQKEEAVTIRQMPPVPPEETHQREYVKRYGERYLNSIYIGRK